MASNHTEHFSLNQWLPDDQVKRTEFNDDNLRIDTILGDHSAILSKVRTQAQLLRTASAEDYSENITLDLSGIHWEDWEYLILTFDGNRAHSLTDNTRGTIYVYVQNSTQVVSAYSSLGAGGFAQSKPNPFLLLLLPFHRSEHQVRGICISDSCSFGVAKCSFSDVRSLRLGLAGGNYHFNSEVKVELWGTR